MEANYPLFQITMYGLELATGITSRITAKVEDKDAPVNGALWSHNGKMLVYNRYVAAGNERYLQIVKIQ